MLAEAIVAMAAGEPGTEDEDGTLAGGERQGDVVEPPAGAA